MRLLTLYRRSLLYHWRTEVAVVLAVLTGTAALTGALLVGDSMRGTLRAMALRRLGRIDHALIAPRFFREALADDLKNAAVDRPTIDVVCPAMVLRGAITHADTSSRVNKVQVLGVDDRFAALSKTPLALGIPPHSDDRVAILNRPLANDLGARVGDDVIVRIEKPDIAPGETLLGRREDKSLALRLTVRAIIPADSLGGFVIQPRQSAPRNVFVPLVRLQRAMGREGRINALLVAGPAAQESQTDSLRGALGQSVRPDDLGVRVRLDDERGFIAVESDQLLIPPAAEDAALSSAEAIGAPAGPVLTYLVNEIRLEKQGDDPTDAPEIPYSTASAVDLSALSSISSVGPLRGGIADTQRNDAVYLNRWAADRLGAQIGDAITIDYYVTGDLGRLDTAETTLRLAGILGMDGVGGDASLTPEYPGVTDAAHLGDWDPPFPMDLNRIGPADEDYWDRYRAAPKVVLPLGVGQRLWAERSARFGRLTSIRVGAAPGMDLKSTAAGFERELLHRLAPAQAGLTLQPVRDLALAASRGSTDFGGLFISFSFFVIIAAAMLVALTFRLSVERRASQVGLLLATGFEPHRIRHLLWGEGVLLAAIGGALGLLAAGGYAWLMLAGLRSWWSDAVGGSFLKLYVSFTSLVIGLTAGFIIAFVSIALAVRGLTRSPPRGLLAGNVAPPPAPARRRRGSPAVWMAIALWLVAGGLITAAMLGDGLPETAAFFGSGSAALLACLAALWAWLQSDRHGTVSRPGFWAALQLGVRNGTRQPGRSLLTAGLIAAASFVIVAMDAVKHGPPPKASEIHSGTGGFTLLGESSIPLLADPNTREGRERLNLSVDAGGPLSSAKFVPFRLRHGDESSCLNLYQPNDPRILGATEAFIERGGFVFQSSLAETAEQKRNPWTLLRDRLADGAIPAIGDYNSVKWLMHLGLGKELVIRDGRDREVSLRIVGMLSGSILQGELVIAESHFVELFPHTVGYEFFLIEVAPAAAHAAEQTLESQLAAYGFDVTGTRERLAEYLRIENTYLSTFQTLGGLGLVLGTLGMAAVLLRNVFERRGELALMRALGYRRASLAVMVLSENAALMASGLAAGSLSALLAIGPHALSSPQAVPWLALGATLAAVFLTGLVAGAAALVPTLRAPLLPALRSE